MVFGPLYRGFKGAGWLQGGSSLVRDPYLRGVLDHGCGFCGGLAFVDDVA